MKDQFKMITKFRKHENRNISDLKNMVFETFEF